MVEFGAEVLAVTPASNPRGERIVKVDFGIEEKIIITNKDHHPQMAPPFMVGMMGPAMPSLKNPLQIRLIMFLTLNEWGSMKRKYTAGDKFVCSIAEEDSTITLKPISGDQ